MKKFFLVSMAALGFAVASLAQDSDVPKYQRSSLHMVLLTTTEPAVEGSEEFTEQVDKS